jgi:hypothetical protein
MPQPCLDYFCQRILSAILAVIDGDGLISSLFSRTAAMSIAALDLFSS